MAFIITKDYFPDTTAPAGTNGNAVGVVGPRSYKGDCSELTHIFRMLDDDGEVMYEGKSSSCDDEKAFQPLDCFGEPNAGCTIIQYKNANGVWETL